MQFLDFRWSGNPARAIKILISLFKCIFMDEVVVSRGEKCYGFQQGILEFHIRTDVRLRRDYISGDDGGIYYLLSWDNRRFLENLLDVMYEELPMPRMKKKK